MLTVVFVMEKVSNNAEDELITKQVELKELTYVFVLAA